MLDLRALPAPDARAPARADARTVRADAPDGFAALLDPLERAAPRAIDRGACDIEDRVEVEADRPDRHDLRRPDTEDREDPEGREERGDGLRGHADRPHPGAALSGAAGSGIASGLPHAARGMGVEAGLLVGGVDPPELPEGVRLRRLSDAGALIGERLRSGGQAVAGRIGSGGPAEASALPEEDAEGADAEIGASEDGKGGGEDPAGIAPGSRLVVAEPFAGSGGSRGDLSPVAPPQIAAPEADPAVAERAERVADLSAALPAAPSAVRLEVQDGAGRWTLGVQRAQQVVSLEFGGDAGLREVVRGAERELEAGIARHGDRLGAIHWRSVEGAAAADLARSGRDGDPGGGRDGGARDSAGRDGSADRDGGDRGGRSAADRDGSGDRGGDRGASERGGVDRGGVDRGAAGAGARGSRGHLFERVIR